MSAISEESPSEVESEFIGVEKTSEPTHSESEPNSSESDVSNATVSSDLSSSSDPSASDSASDSSTDNDSGVAEKEQWKNEQIHCKTNGKSG